MKQSRRSKKEKREKPLPLEEKKRIVAEILGRCNLVADCWVYPTKNNSGYGHKRVKGRVHTVSRILLAYHTRESLNIPFDACHEMECPYRACCNPRHLKWGTHAENAAEREAKERMDRFDHRWAIDPPLDPPSLINGTIRVDACTGVDIHDQQGEIVI